MSERINEVSTLGTGRRGFGAKIHLVNSWSYDTTEGKHYNGMQANCNGNGQWTARDFQAGTAREVTCLICNPKEALPTPTERTPKADSCQATNKKTGKQCTFKGYCTSNLTGGRRCATHMDWRSPGGQGYPDYVAPVVLPVSVEDESENWTDESSLPAFCEDCGHADPSNLTQLSSIDGESVYLLCFRCKDTRIQIRQLQGTPGPARLAKMFPMGKGWSR